MEKIRVLTEESVTWNVSIGNQAINLLERKGLKGDEKGKVLNEACDILGNCGDPSKEENSITGLAIGYVQSGKTLSFTTVAALASENKFNAILIIAGSTTKLVDQTSKRLERDLDIYKRSEISWKLFKNPKKNQEDKIYGDMEVGLFNDKPILLITVMKNISHLKNLNYLFDSKRLKSLNLKVLIIDDEADQASLNTKANTDLENDVSAIYNSITNLRKKIKNHTYLQYTATPQGPLLISILDILSPDFVKILYPGSKYTGGKYFFNRNIESNYPNIRKIPDDEIYSKNNPISKIPSSLEDALIFFYLTVLIGINKGEHSTTHNRTMMIHPSQLTDVHKVYLRWVLMIRNRWLDELAENDSDIDKKNLIDKFYKIYSIELESSIYQITKSDIQDKINLVIKTTPIILANSTEKNNLDWRENYSRILVGGMILDRGFTVEGLNVTYMPRSIGVGNADTIQQRCRFFGYKKDYIDLCRIFLPRISTRAYIEYVRHEEHLRQKLEEYGRSGKTLKEFKREFFLSPMLNLTRKNIISDEIKRYKLLGWRDISNIDDNYLFNNKIIELFISKLNFTNSKHSGETTEQKHQESDILCEELINNLLTNLTYKNASSSLLLNHMISLIGLLNEKQSYKIKVINIKCGLVRERAINIDKNEIPQLFQGSNKKTNYYGDRAVKSEKNITIQIHNLKIKNKNINFRTIAFHIPENHGQNIFFQS
tara:strand:- start:1508 stop:3646 length:2139 start_codon:yes stop_codon:yes gene_type:complete